VKVEVRMVGGFLDVTFAVSYSTLRWGLGQWNKPSAFDTEGL